ncbi:hypothetical protein HDU93_001442 [Gonapodya sp. JEL0774]|nr:hypothetical protein HDU93_001442 [Gonapodya sp. JEL0774]
MENGASWLEWADGGVPIHPLFHYFAAPLNLLHETSLPFQGQPWLVLEKVRIESLPGQYNPVNEDEIALFPMNAVSLQAIFRDGWGYGTNLTTGAIGMFPLDYLDLSPLGISPPRSGTNSLARSSSLLRGTPASKSGSFVSGSNGSGRTATIRSTSAVANTQLLTDPSRRGVDVRGPELGAVANPFQSQNLVPSSSMFPQPSNYQKFHSAAMQLIPTEVMALPSFSQLPVDQLGSSAYGGGGVPGYGSMAPSSGYNHLPSQPPSAYGGGGSLRTVSQRWNPGDVAAVGFGVGVPYQGGVVLPRKDGVS